MKIKFQSDNLPVGEVVHMDGIGELNNGEFVEIDDETLTFYEANFGDIKKNLAKDKRFTFETTKKEVKNDA